MTETFYIASRMRGVPLYNFPLFFQAAEDIRDMGYNVVSPAEVTMDMLGLTSIDDVSNELLDEVDFGDAMEIDFKMICDADGIVLLPGWEESEGACAERFMCETMGKPVLAYYPAVDNNPSCLRDAEPWDRPILHKKDGPSEVRVTDPSTGGQKSAKICRMDLIPSDVLWELGEHYGKGELKYPSDPEPNWQRGYSWRLSVAALQRHLHQFIMGEDEDEETGSSHLIAVAWHAFALRWFQLHDKGTDYR